MTQLQQIVTASAQRGLNLQLALRGVLVAFVLATLAFLPPFLLYVALQKEFVEGIALSGIKG